MGAWSDGVRWVKEMAGEGGMESIGTASIGMMMVVAGSSCDRRSWEQGVMGIDEESKRGYMKMDMEGWEI